MKTKRFLSLFSLFLLLFSLWSPAAAAYVPEPLSDPEILAKAALLVDAETGTVAYAKNEHQELYPASLTKVMTALLVLEAVDKGTLSLSQSVTASASALEGLSKDGSSANIKVGETMTVENLLYCMLVVSANEACDILAEAVSGSVSAFVDAMNSKAAELGCVNTHFANPNGLHDSSHYTSAWDLYLITRKAMESPTFMTICDTAHAVIPATNLSEERSLWTTNNLLSSWRVIGYRNTEAHGIKTGSTTEAGHCLISSSTRGSLHFISVILGANRTEENGVGNLRSFSETTRLFNWGFEHFSYQTLLKSDQLMEEVAVSLSKTDFVTVHPAQDVEALLPNEISPEDLEQVITLTQDPVEAPIAEGEVLGELTLRYGSTEYARVDLLALNDVEASQLLVFLQNLKLFFAKTSVRIGCIALGILLVLFLLWRLTGVRRRSRYGQGAGRSARGNYRGRKR